MHELILTRLDHRHRCRVEARGEPYSVRMSDRIEPVAALQEIAYRLERERQDIRRVQAFRRAAEVLQELPVAEFAARSSARTWRELAGIGASTAAVIEEAVAGLVPARLASLRAAERPLVEGGEVLLAALRGDLHSHTDASDGSSSIELSRQTATELGHEYLAITDHSPRLRVANGLSAARLAAQLDRIDELNSAPGARLLKGIEVDILSDGSLDQQPELLNRLEVVVASVHSELRMPTDAMTRRMVAAIAAPHTNILGHCTGRLVTGDRGTRAPSVFDAEIVFEACRQFDVAVEINSRPERQDPPDELLQLALGMGCLFSIDSDAHAPGQLEFPAYGAARAEAAGVPPERVVNTWPAADLLAWTGQGR